MLSHASATSTAISQLSYWCNFRLPLNCNASSLSRIVLEREVHQRLGEWRNWAFFILIKRKQAINRLMEIGAKFAASFSELEDSVVLVCWSWCVIQIVVCSISLPMISLAQYCLKLRDCHSFMAFSGESSMVNCLTFPNQRILMGRNPFWFKTSGWPSQQYWPRRTQYIVPSWARDCYAEMCSIFIGLSRKAVWCDPIKRLGLPPNWVKKPLLKYVCLGIEQ